MQMSSALSRQGGTGLAEGLLCEVGFLDELRRVSCGWVGFLFSCG